MKHAERDKPWRRAARAPLLGLALAIGGCGAAIPPSPAVSDPATVRQSFGVVNAERLAHATQQSGEWFTSGGDSSQAYFSHLDSINAGNVRQLGFAWDYPLHTTRGLEATPIVVDGILYTSGVWGRVYALDAATGRELWTYDPAVDTQWARSTCCDAVNRGVAVWQGKVYVASLDGYLHALDAETGHLVWKRDTLVTREATDFHYFISGAPLIAGDVVVIGNGGGDFRGARGSLSAYDLTTGQPRWRFFTVPRDPALGRQDQPHLDKAAATWPKNYDWSMGGGGSVWDGLSYDPKLGLIYFGTGNPSPYALADDRPQNDQLYTDALLAVRARTGELAWHYQEVPGDGWDYDATQKAVLTSLQIAGSARDVLLQAAKNGYVYVLDRGTGELLLAKPFAFVNWTKGIDPKSGRPIRSPLADYTHQPKLIFPAMTGAHSWQPMSYDLATQLLYIPVIDAPMVYIETSERPAGLIEGNFTVAGVFPEAYEPNDMKSLFGSLPALPTLEHAVPGQHESRGALRAFNPVTGQVAWEQPGALWDGGVLSTAGNLVLQGDVTGFLNVYAADGGALLHRIDVGTSMMAAPMTYQVRGEQYIAVMAGFGGGLLASPFPDNSAAKRYGNAGRIVVFKLGGGDVPKPAAVAEVSAVSLAPREGTATSIASGELLYNRYCSRCHVFGVGLLPDLRRMSPVTRQLFYDIVLNGVYQGKGMARWDDVLTKTDTESIYHYLIDQSWTAFASPSSSSNRNEH